MLNISANEVAAIVITYRPDLSLLERGLRAIAPQVACLLVVDNGSGEQTVASIRDLLDELYSNHTETRNISGPAHELLSLGENLGIAAAQNRGIRRCSQLGMQAVVLLDHDSVAPAGMISGLLSSLREGITRGLPVGAVGPFVAEQRAAELLVYVDTPRGPQRVPAHLTTQDVEAAFLLSSGCLIPLEVLRKIGPMNEKFFIDHVDLEWGIRARNAGYTLLASHHTTLEHHLGDEVARVPGRSQPVHIHGPIRNYYLARNTIALIRGQVISRGWKLGYLIWLAKYAGFNALCVAPRLPRIRLLARGVRDGLKGHGGRFPQP